MAALGCMPPSYRVTTNNSCDRTPALIRSEDHIYKSSTTDDFGVCGTGTDLSIFGWRDEMTDDGTGMHDPIN